MIRRNITYKEKKLNSFTSQSWRPYPMKDVDMLDKIQRRATKLIPGSGDLSYEEGLKECV